MNIQMIPKRAFAGLFSLGLSLISTSLVASPFFNGTNADAWLVDNSTGQIQGYNLNKWVEQYDPADFPNIILDSNKAILVNNLPNSSSVLSVSQPSISLVGLGESIEVGAEPSGLSLVPASGTFSETISIDIRVNTALLGQGATSLIWQVTGKQPQLLDLSNLTTLNTQDGYFIKTIHLVKNGDYDVEVKLLTNSGSNLESLSAEYRIDATEDQLRRDTDGDSLPDLVELDIGLDPLTNDWDADLDGDGWKEVDTWLRKFCLNAVTKIPVVDNSCLDEEGLPIDSDNDNWSDFDEILRGTNPEDILFEEIVVDATETNVSDQQFLRYKDYPSVSRLYEVEYQIDNGLLQAESSPNLTWSEAGAVTINGRTLYESNELISVDELSDDGLSLDQVANRLTKPKAITSFENNELPKMRLPASDSVVINVTHRYHLNDTEETNVLDTSEDYKRIYKAWLPRLSDVTPKMMLEEIGEGDWTTAEEWREAFIAYLLPRLTISQNPNINIDSTLPINVIEAVLSKESAFQGLSEIQLYTPSNQFGDLQFSKTWEKSLRRFAENYSLDQTVIAIENALGSGKPLAGHADWLRTNFFAGIAGTRSDEYLVKQFLAENTAVETSAADILRQYQFRLLTLPEASNAVADDGSLLESGGDTDFDDLLNEQEINQTIDLVTLPWFNDTDGDEIADADDECANDPLNLCGDNPVLPFLSVDADFSVLEPAEGMDVAIIGVRLDEPTEELVTISYETLLSATDTAVDGADFTAISGTVTIAAGQQTALIEIPILSDTNDEEGNETFSLQITQLDNAELAEDGIVVITLNDNIIEIPSLDAPIIVDADAMVYEKDVAILPLNFTNNGGGELISCTVDSLPAGLEVGVSEDASSCTINGTPTEIQITTAHTITATNATGSDSALVSIEVVEQQPVEAPNFENLPLQTLIKGVEITPFRFVNNGGGGITICDPEVVPPGLTVSITEDKKSCEFSGTPESTQANSEHFLAAVNPIGSSVATVSIEILENPSSDTTSPIASQFTPADGSVNVALDTVVSSVFNEDMFAQTITDESFILKDMSGETISSTVNFDALTNKIVLTSDDNLPLLTTITANLKSSITDLSGNQLENTLWQFSTREGSWKESVEISDAFDEGGVSQVSMDKNGSTVVVWEADKSIWSNSYHPDTGWSDAQVLDASVPYNNATGNFKTNSAARVSMNTKGNALAIWVSLEVTGTTPNLQYKKELSAKFYDALTKTWEETVPIIQNISSYESGSPTTSSPVVDLNDEGNAIVAWYQKESAFELENIWASTYSESNGWETPLKIESNDSGRTLSPKVIADASSNFIVVWSQYDSQNNTNIWANRFSSGSWGNALKIDEGDSGNGSQAEIAVDKQGNAVVIWESWLGSGNFIWANTYDVETNIWGVTQRVASDLTYSNEANIAMNDSGKTIAIWRQDGDVWVSHFDISTNSWSDQVKIEQLDGTNVRTPQIVIDRNGNAIAIWRHYLVDKFTAQSSRYDSILGWQDTVELVSGAGAFIAISSDGQSTLVWSDARDDVNGNYIQTIKARVFE